MLVIVYMLVPIAVIFVFSFNNPAGRYNFTWVGFTLKHWKNVFGDSGIERSPLDLDQAGAAGDADLDRSSAR